MCCLMNVLLIEWIQMPIANLPHKSKNNKNQQASFVLILETLQKTPQFLWLTAILRYWEGVRPVVFLNTDTKLLRDLKPA